MVGKMNPSQKINAGSKSRHGNFAGVEGKGEPHFKKLRYLRNEACYIAPALMHYHEVICVSDIVPNSQFSFHKLVKFIHIRIGKKLARQIAEWKTCPSQARRRRARATARGR